MFRGLSEEGLLTNLWGDKFLIDIKREKRKKKKDKKK